jgi:alpha-glucosidase (family GH31 glycosyl hydrolase)
MDYYVIAGTLSEVLDRYTQMTGRSPLPPRWTLGYMQSKFGYRNWDEVFAVRDAFRTNDLPLDAVILDLYWFGEATDIGSLSWATNTFPNAASNIAVLGASGIKVINIHEPYINRDSARSSPNFKAAAARHYLVSTDAAMTQSSIVVNGLFGTMGYFDFSNPTARGWWFEKLRPIINDGVAAHWTDLGEPEQDHPDDFLMGGRCESEIHNVYNLLWHRAVAEGYATNYPTQRLFMLSRSGFAGDQRFGAAHWSNDVSGDWPTLVAHPTALCNYGLSGMSYFGSDIGGFFGMPSDELYVRWFQFGAFCPVFRAHGVRKPVAPYEFSSSARDCCRDMLKLRYRMLPYIYNAARETYDTGLPMCRALPLAFPNDAKVLNDGSEFMFGPSILVAPVTTEGALSRSVYLPAGRWIDHWSSQVLMGPVTTNWPAPISQIPLFYQDNSIIPFGPAVASSQMDDGTKRGLRIYCSTTASVTLYDDDGESNGYRSNQFARTLITATRNNDEVTVRIGAANGSYRGQPQERSWEIAIFNDANNTWVRGDLPTTPVNRTAQITVPLQPR